MTNEIQDFLQRLTVDKQRRLETLMLTRELWKTRPDLKKTINQKTMIKNLTIEIRQTNQDLKIIEMLKQYQYRR